MGSRRRRQAASTAALQARMWPARWGTMTGYRSRSWCAGARACAASAPCSAYARACAAVTCARARASAASAPRLCSSSAAAWRCSASCAPHAWRCASDHRAPVGGGAGKPCGAARSLLAALAASICHRIAWAPLAAPAGVLSVHRVETGFGRQRPGLSCLILEPNAPVAVVRTLTAWRTHAARGPAAHVRRGPGLQGQLGDGRPGASAEVVHMLCLYWAPGARHARLCSEM